MNNLSGFDRCSDNYLFAQDLSLLEKVSDGIKMNINSIDIDRYRLLSYPKITCGIMTYNESRCIERCINSVKDDVDEIILIDSGSTDGTLDLVRDKFPFVRIFEKKWNDDFSEPRNYILELAEYDWVLFVDADEFLDAQYKGKIKSVIKVVESVISSEQTFCLSPIVEEINGGKHYNLMRIFKKSSGIKFSGRIHEEPLTSFGENPEHVMTQIKFFHDGYSKEIISGKEKLFRNIRLLERMLIEEPQRPKWYYFYARDLAAKSYYENDHSNKTICDHIIIEKLEFFIANFTKEIDYHKYLPEVLVVLCNSYVKVGRWGDLQNKLQILKECSPDCVDINYFNVILHTKYYKHKLNKLISSSMELETGSRSYIHSEKHHLMYISFLTLFNMGEFDRALEVLNKIDDLSIYKEKGNEYLKHVSGIIERYSAVKQ